MKYAVVKSDMVENVLVASPEQKEQFAAEQPAPEPTAEERIAVLEEALNMLLSGVTE